MTVKKALRTMIGLALVHIAVANPAYSQTNPGGGGPSLDEIVVTGSRIPQAPGQTIEGVTVITSADLEARGFKNAFDALNTLA